MCTETALHTPSFGTNCSLSAFLPFLQLLCFILPNPILLASLFTHSPSTVGNMTRKEKRESVGETEHTGIYTCDFMLEESCFWADCSCCICPAFSKMCQWITERASGLKKKKKSNNPCGKLLELWFVHVGTRCTKGVHMIIVTFCWK